LQREELEITFEEIALEMIYYLYVAEQPQLAFDLVEYFAEAQNRDLGIVKRSQKPKNRLIVSPFSATGRSPEQFFF